MALVSFYRVLSTSNLPTNNNIVDGALYFVEDTQSFYRGIKIETPSQTGGDPIISYELTPVKVLINDINATLSDEDVLKVITDDSTLPAASREKLDKPMDTEALYKTFLTRGKEFKIYFVPDRDIVTITAYDGNSYFDESTGTYGRTITIPDIEGTLNSLSDTFKDGKTIVFIKKTEIKYEITSFTGGTGEIDIVAWADLEEHYFGYGHMIYPEVSNPTYDDNSTKYDEFIYSIVDQQWEKIGDWTEDLRPRWEISRRSYNSEIQ